MVIFGGSYHSMLKNLLNLVFPAYCPACDRNLGAQETVVCMDCLFDLELTQHWLKPMENPLYYRFAGKVPLDGAASLSYFDKKGKLQAMINALKYKNHPKMGRFLGQYLGAQLTDSSFLQGDEVLVPVPLHPARLRERGYNQSEEIAKGMKLAIPHLRIDTKSLARARKTATQTRKSKEERAENMQDVFELRGPLDGNIVLVDDVITTGATLESCIRTLFNQAAKPQSIKVVSLGVAR